MDKSNLTETLTAILQSKTNKVLSKSILHTADAMKISSSIDRFCQQNLGSSVVSCLYAGFSVGASFGLTLLDGREIFLKLHKPTSNEDLNAISMNSLTTISHIQGHLAEAGFPCPNVILQPIKYENSIITVQSFEDVGEQKDAHDPLIRKALARTFSELIARTQSYKAEKDLTYGRLFTTPSLYPNPHNELFNFEKTAKGAEWIDEIAITAKKVTNEVKGETVIGHADWSLKNLRLQGNKVVMVYDWDSLTLEDELNLLGIAAATFPTSWDIETKITPSPEEAYLFVREYEYFRGKSFSKKELEKIAAATTYCIAYTARCEHAIDSFGNRLEGSFRQALEKINGNKSLYFL
ncbi:phosphotransferase [Lederbergia graminis]|uniref:Phosphotransferase n=1 Tax=Lederbergia graminis TaxID=735518 RepID=A0ABW0LJ29_9BACI